MRRALLTGIALGICALMGTRLGIEGSQAQPSSGQAFSPVIPKTWDDAAIATLEVPLANPIGSPKHVPASYYYKIPVLPIYKSYTVYAPGHEPPCRCQKLNRPQRADYSCRASKDRKTC